MTRTYAVVNQKGGVGKTTTALNLAACFALAGRRVLMVDLDPQGNATSGLGVRKGALDRSTWDVLIEGAELASATVPTPVGGLALLPATVDLAGADLAMADRPERETLLRRALEPAQGGFDTVIIDVPPSLGLLTVCALVACERVIIPIQAEFYALEGISQLLATIERVKQGPNPQIAIRSVILTMYDRRARLSRQVAAEIRRYFGDVVSAVEVPRNVRLAEAPSHGVPVSLYDPRSRGARAYQAIAEEMLRHA